MSGICGFVRLDGALADPAHLDAMRARLAHRGPDGAGAWTNGPAALAYTHLITTPESVHETQPVVAPGGSLALVADARLDNRAEVLAALGQPDTIQPDSAVLLAAFACWGEACFERLVGDFALAAWDATQRRLVLARDPMGERPLYYYHGPAVFAFASEIKALLALPEVPVRINPVRVADYLTPMLEDSSITFYDGILRLAETHSLVLDASGQVRTRRYFQFDPDYELRLKSDDDYAEAFREVFFEAVRCRLRATATRAAMLSGGLDSTSVVSAAVRLLDGQTGPLHTFSIIFDQAPRSDERKYINAALADLPGVTPHFIPGDPVSPLTDIERMLWALDGPPPLGGYSMQWLMYGAVRDHGMRLLLDGNGGDAVLSYGTTYLAELLRAGRWRTLARELLAFAGYRKKGRLALAARLGLAWAVRPLLPPWVAVLRERVVDLGRPLWDYRKVVNREFARELKRTGQLDRWQAPPKAAPSTARQHHLYGLLMLARTQVEHNHGAAAFNLDQRHPFQDVRLARFCLSLPAELRMRSGATRYIARIGLRGILPETVRQRQNKATPMYSMLRALRSKDLPLIESVIFDDAERLRPYVNLKRVQRRYLRARDIEGQALADWLALMDAARVAALGLWLRQMEGRQVGS